MSLDFLPSAKHETLPLPLPEMTNDELALSRLATRDHARELGYLVSLLTEKFNSAVGEITLLNTEIHSRPDFDVDGLTAELWRPAGAMSKTALHALMNEIIATVPEEAPSVLAMPDDEESAA